MVYTQVAAGRESIGLLRSDGNAMVFIGEVWLGHYFLGHVIHHLPLLRESRIHMRRCEVPALEPGLTYTQVDVSTHAVLLQSDGVCVAFSPLRAARLVGHCDVPPLDEGLHCVQVSAGREHTVLLLSDGRTLAFGNNMSGQCDVPPLPPGLTYTSVAASMDKSVFSRSDGLVLITDGRLGAYQPELEPGLACAAKAMPAMVLQAALEERAVRFRTLSRDVFF